MGGGRVTTRFNAAELAVVVAAAGPYGSVGVFVKRVVLEAARGSRSAGAPVRVSGGRPPSPVVGPAVARGAGPVPPLEGQVVAVVLVDAVASRVGSVSLAMRALRLGQVRLGGVVVRDGAMTVIDRDVTVSGAG